MFKRFTARLLILLQFYNCVFQGVAHANVIQAHHAVRDEIYLHTAPSKDGGLRIALGTNRGGDAGGEELLDVIEVPAYRTLSKTSQDELAQRRIDLKKALGTSSADADAAAKSLQPDRDQPVLGLDPRLGLEADSDLDSSPDLDTHPLFSKSGVTRSPEGAHFTLQGLEIFVSNTGEALILGKQTDFSKPIFLSSTKGIVLKDVDASTIKLIAPAILGVGSSNIDFLSLEGLTETAVFINGGSLTAKEIFLKNLNTTNAKTIKTIAIEAQGGIFNNTGHLEAETKIGLGTDKFINSGTVTAESIQGLESLKVFENTAKGKVKADTIFKTGEQTAVINHGSLEGDDYQIIGASLQQHGKIHAKSLTTGKDTVITTSPTQEMVLEESLVSDSTLPLSLAGTVSVKEFDYAGKLDLHGTLNATFFKGHGTIQTTGKLTSGHTHLIGDLTNLGAVDAQVLEADARLSTHGQMRVRHHAKVTGAFTVTPEGSLTGYQDDPLTLTLPGAAAIAGKVDVDILDAKSIHLTGAGQLLSKQKTSLDGGLTVDKDAVAELKGLKVTKGAIINQGELRVTGVDPTSIAIKLTNSGNASIDGEQVLPKVDAQSPENLVRVAAMTWPMVCSLSIDHEFNHDNSPDCRINGLKYFRLHKALSTKVAYGDDIDSSAAFAIGQDVRKLATRYKRDFLKLYESLLARSTTEGAAAEQAELQQYLKQFEPLYQETLTKRAIYAQSLPAARGAALMVESAKSHTIKLHLLNQATGQLTLKSGKFEFVGDTALVNDGTLTQESAYTLWLTSTTGVFNRGTWQAKGSLGLLGYIGQAVGKLEVADSLHVDTTLDALEAFRGLGQAKTRKIIMHAPRVKDTFRADKVLPWVVELHLLEDFESVGNIYTCGLQLFCRNFGVSGDLSADIKDGAEVLDPEQGFLRVTATHNAKVGVAGYLYGRKAAAIRAQYLTIEGREQIPGASITDYPANSPDSRIIYRRAQNGIYSLDGPVCLDFSEELLNHFGTIKGTYFVVNGKTFRNVAGFMQGTDATQSSQIVADKISNLREGLEKYKYATMTYGATCYLRGRPAEYGVTSTGWAEKYCETSPQAILEHAGDLTLIYRTLTNEVSDITSAKRLFLDARRSDQTLAVGDVGNRTQLEAEMARTASPHPGITVTWDRNGHTSLIRGKHSVTGTLGDAQLAGGVHARSIALTAVQMTLLNRELDQAQSASLVRLAQHIQNSQSSMYRLIGDGRTYDTRFALSQSARMFPRSIVSMTSMPGNMPLNLGATWGAFEYAYGQNFPYIYRGLEYLGLSFADLCEMSAEEVRARQGAQVTRRLITDGRDSREVDVVTHHELTSPQALGKAFMPMLVMEFGRNISRVKADIDRAEQAKAIEAQARNLSSRSQDLLKAAQAVEPQEQFDFSLFVPKQKTVHGLKGDGGRTDVLVTDGDFTSLGATVSGHGGSIRVPQGGVKVLSQTQRVYTGDILHGEESFHDVVLRAGVENYGTGADREFRIVSATDIEIEGAKFKAAEKDSVITMATPGQIIDRALAVQSRQTTESYSRNSHTVTVTDETIMDPTQYSGAGAVDMHSGGGVSTQAPDVACTVRVTAPFLALPDAINQRSVRSTTETHGQGFFGVPTKKTVTSTMQAFFSRGGKLRGPAFIATVQHFSATHVEFDTKADITATQSVELLASRSSSSSYTKTVSQDAIWNRVSVDTEKHLTHQPCTFMQRAIFRTAPSLIMERVRGSGAVANVVSDSPLQYRDLDDVHEHHHHSQKSLTAGAALITKLAVGLILYSNPVTFGLSGAPGVMVNAGFGALCGDTAVCLIENDGDIGRTMRELGKRDVVKNVARSMLAAGLVHGITDLTSTTANASAGGSTVASKSTEMASGASSSTSVAVASTPAVSTAATTSAAAQATTSAASTMATEIASKTFEEYAKQAVIQSAVNTALSVAMDGQDFREALKQGIAMAGIHAVASYAAGKIGDLYKVDATDRISGAAHKALHLGLGSALGAATAAVTGQDIGRSALSGGVGGMLGETFAEAFDSKPLGDLLATTVAFATGLDAGVAYLASANATEHNYQAHHRLYLQQLGLDTEEVDVEDGAEEAVDTYDVDKMVPPPTPRTRAGLIAVRGFEQVERDYPATIERWKSEGRSRENTFAEAYENAEIAVLTATAWKGLTGGEISDYERQVSAERGVVWAIGVTIDRTIFRGVPVVGQFCSKTFSKTLKQALAPAVKRAAKGEYRLVGGHHVHAKKAFEGHINYNPKKGFCVSQQFMKDHGIDHDTVTSAQRKLFGELAKSGRPNTIYEHSRIAVEALVKGKASPELARKIVAESLSDLRKMGVRNPVKIPWY